jgi:hypothetical protein
MNKYINCATIVNRGSIAICVIYISTNFIIKFFIYVHSVRFEVFTAVTMKNGVFWDVTPCGFCNNRRFGGT